jgi:predicted Zn-dependent protease
VKVPVSIKVLETDEPNAMALPGGFFFVNTGLLKLAQNESEIAGVMGHELAHIAARHATRQMTRAGIVSLATIPMMILGGGWAMYGIYQASNLLIPITFLKFSREFESEADMLGLQYMYKAGYDPNGFVDMFERLESMEKRKPGTISKMFTSHPPTGDRIVKVQEITAKYLKEKPEYVVTTSEFDDVRDRLMMLENHRKTASADPNRPRLRKAPGAGGTTIDGDDTSNQQTKEGDDERPTLKRRDQPQN